MGYCSVSREGVTTFGELYNYSGGDVIGNMIYAPVDCARTDLL